MEDAVLACVSFTGIVIMGKTLKVGLSVTEFDLVVFSTMTYMVPYFT